MSTGVLSRRSVSQEEDELLSDDRLRATTVEEELPIRLLVDAHDPETQEQPEEAEASAEEAEEIDAAEAAKALGRRRPGRSLRTSSPELGSGAVEAEQEAPEPRPESKTRKRARPRASSPAAQDQAAAISMTNTTIKPGPQPKTHKDAAPGKKQRKRDSAPGKGTRTNRRKSGDSDGNDDDAIEITIQRFANNRTRVRSDGDDGDLDPLQAEIPYANCAGESVVDVLAQVCDEVMAATLAQFRELADEADSAAKKKECRVKMRAIEAYRGELGSRLLQHVCGKVPQRRS